MRRLLALATVAASLLSILASPFDARYVKAEMQAARARVPISTLVAPPNVASYFVSLTNTLMKPAYLDDAFHDAALIFRDQVRARKRRLLASSPHLGCTRRLARRHAAHQPREPLAIWQ